jgi:hypothetical protein
MANNPQREFYDSMRNKYRKIKDIDEIPKFMRIYLEVENKHIDYINKLYYSICDYLYLDIEPCRKIRNSKEWVLLEDYLDEEKEDSANYGDL